MRVILFGRDAESLTKEVAKHPQLDLVDDAPDAIICYGGDGTLLHAEHRWPGVPKAPIRNSRRGHRCLPHSAADVIERLAQGDMVDTEFLRIQCQAKHADDPSPFFNACALNEFNVHMGHINSAVRFTLFIDARPYEGGLEIVGDGLVVCTPFGSTAYFNQITRGLFFQGIGVAFKYTREHTNNLVLPESAVVRIRITRGPAVLALDNVPQYINLREGDELTIQRHPEPASVLLWDKLAYPTHAY